MIKTRLFELVNMPMRNLAHLIGVSLSELYLVRSHSRGISGRFIVGVLGAFPQYKFEDLFYMKEKQIREGLRREEVLAMEPGMELDKLVAEAFDDVFDDCGEEVYQHFLRDDKRAGWTRPAPVSTDPSVAWQVLKKVGLAIFRLNNGDWVACLPSYLYQLDITKDHYIDPNLIICKTAPEAICKASLLAGLAKNGIV